MTSLDPSQIKPKKTERFSIAIKIHAVLKSNGYGNINPIAKQLHVSSHTISSWRKAYREGKYTEELPPPFTSTVLFRLDAVQRSNGKGNIDVVAEQLNLPRKTIKNWRRAYMQGKYTEQRPPFNDVAAKLKAIKKSNDRGSIVAVAQEFNVSISTLKHWRGEYIKGRFTSAPPPIKTWKDFKIDLLERKLKTAKSEAVLLKAECEILKKTTPILWKKTEEKYLFISRYKNIFSIMKMFSILDVCPSSYYVWLTRPPSRRDLYSQMLRQEIKKVYNLHEGRYGVLRMTKELQMKGIKTSVFLVHKLMREEGLQGKNKRKSKITTVSSQRFPAVENKLMQNFVVTRPNEIWVSDITFIRVQHTWLYLTAVIDLFDRKIIGWEISSTLGAKNTSVAAFKKAVINRPIQEEHTLIFHSDRGVQYTAKPFVSETRKHISIIRSMSRKANSCDNAVAESFFRTIKVELIYQNEYETKEQAEQSIFDYIENYYNVNRRHGYLGNLTITEFQESVDGGLSDTAL